MGWFDADAGEHWKCTNLNCKNPKLGVNPRRYLQRKHQPHEASETEVVAGVAAQSGGVEAADPIASANVHTSIALEAYHHALEAYHRNISCAKVDNGAGVAARSDVTEAAEAADLDASARAANAAEAADLGDSANKITAATVALYQCKLQH